MIHAVLEKVDFREDNAPGEVRNINQAAFGNGYNRILDKEEVGASTQT